MLRVKTLLFPLLLLTLGCAADDVGPGGDQSGTGDQPGDQGSGDGSDHVPTALEHGLDVGGMEGNLRFFLTDAPDDFDEVWVDVNSVELAFGADGAGGWNTISSAPTSLDLLALQNDVTQALGDAQLEPGYYGQLRFIVSESYVIQDGEREELTIPSGTQTGIKLNLDFEIEADTSYALVLDFDAAASIRRTGAGLKMQPVIHLEYIGIVNEDGTLTPLQGADTEDSSDEESGEDSSDEEPGEDSSDEESGEDSSDEEPVA